MPCLTSSFEGATTASCLGFLAGDASSSGGGLSGVVGGGVVPQAASASQTDDKAASPTRDIFMATYQSMGRALFALFQMGDGGEDATFHLFDALGGGDLGSRGVGHVEHVGHLGALGVDLGERDLKIEVH